MSFIFFLFFYILIYGSVHTYFFFKVKPLLPTGASSILLIIFLALMVSGPILVRVWEQIGWITPARLLAWISFIWMGILFLFFSTSLILDLIRFVYFVITRVAPLTPQQQFYIPMMLALIVSVYGLFEAQIIRIERLTINSPKVPSGASGFKIAQISDLHMGLIMGSSYQQKVADLIAKENPDLLVSTGDFVDASMCHLNGANEPLIKLKVPAGKFAITGNHEFYAGLDGAIQCTEAAGFRMLRNESVEINEWLTILGVDDDEAVRFRVVENIDEVGLLSDIAPERFVLFLRHRPRVKTETVGKFDLMLSGHTHKGQIFPFSLLTAPWFTHLAGLKKLSDRSNLYVSRGTGCWGPPIR
ncbi:metallophosphoesterase, partial [bacterium]|nr:metallophosphoesterase [bacterium]